jgi:hypothetical protein
MRGCPLFKGDDPPAGGGGVVLYYIQHRSMSFYWY